jgi:hypothetical protein
VKDEIAVFQIVRDSACADCGEVLGKGRMLRMEKDRPLCLTCADLDHLVFLPRGNTALTRRAAKYSTLRAIVRRYSRARKRYERQGTLVEEAALLRAEEECNKDAASREQARLRAAMRRDEIDQEYVGLFAERVRELFANSPPAEADVIARHACRKYSGRVGRSAAAKDLDAKAVELAVRAHVRHTYTEYDQLLARGIYRNEARQMVSDQIDQKMDIWRGGK